MAADRENYVEYCESTQKEYIEYCESRRQDVEQFLVRLKALEDEFEFEITSTEIIQLTEMREGKYKNNPMFTFLDTHSQDGNIQYCNYWDIERFEI